MIEELIKQAKRQNAIQDLNILLQSGNIAFFKACEVTQVFLYRKDDKKVINYYTLFCFDEEESVDNQLNYLLPKLEKIDDEYSVGIIQKRITTTSAKQAFTDIQRGLLNFDGSCQISSQLVLLPKIYVSSLYTNKDVFLNYVLKPNYWGDNYIIEFFDETKDFFSNNETARNKIEKVNKIVKSIATIKIDLEKVYDRIGNIIFQFPITILKTNISSCKDSVNIQIEAASHPAIQQVKNFHIESIARFDNVISGFNTKDVTGINFCEILNVGDDNNLNTIISDNDSGLILHNSEVNFLRGFRFSGKLGMQYSEPRTIKFKDGSYEEVELFTRDAFGNVNSSDKDYLSRVSKRKYNNEIIQKSGDYKLFKGNQRKEALDYIRKKLQSCAGIKEICLWDPYLTATDIMDTLYFENTGIPFRCITSYQRAKTILGPEQNIKNSIFVKIRKWFVSKKEEMSFEQFCKIQNSYFSNYSNNLRIKLKFLAQHDAYGWKFHDRFLIFVPVEASDLPEVYSLGTSVNIIGENHHIIQKVTNPREIFDNFEELWALLDNGKCIVKEFK